MSNTFLGLDRSGNDNNFTVTNMTLASDQMVDSPTNNFATLNSLNIGGGSLSEGNLTWGISSSTGLLCMSSVGFDIASTTHKYYWEVVLNSGECTIGIAPLELRGSDTGRAGSYSYYSSAGDKYLGASGSSYGASFTDDDIIGIAVGGGTIEFFKNNVSQGDAWTGLTGTFVPFISEVTCNITANFGQDSSFAGAKTAQGNTDGGGKGDFYYTPPSGFKALCTANLPEPAVTPSEYFNAKIYTGTGADQVVTMGLQPDILWVANRGDTESKPAVNSLGGATKYMHLDATTAEATDSTIITNFTSTGFTAGGDNKTSASGDDYVAYAWGGLTSSASGSTSGSGDAQSYSAKYNTDAGMSIIDYDGNTTAGHTIPHHLGVAPGLILVKHHTTQAWNLYIKPTGEAEFGWSVQFSNNWYGSNNGIWNDTSPTSTVFTVSAATGVNRNLINSSGAGYYAYCFAEKDGFSKFGTYTGSSTTDNTFVYTGFRPKFVLTKGLVNDHGWNTWDTVRELHLDNPLSAAWGFSTTGAEEGPYSSSYVDLVANGFKLRNTQSTGINNRKYLYIAFAETPFKYANAR